MNYIFLERKTLFIIDFCIPGIIVKLPTTFMDKIKYFMNAGPRCLEPAQTRLSAKRPKVYRCEPDWCCPACMFGQDAVRGSKCFQAINQNTSYFKKSLPELQPFFFFFFFTFCHQKHLAVTSYRDSKASNS